ncbi:uncharacterized protein AKAW2_50119S [Aspergillus luchuensis]|uniref:Uncharacterized protein n=1 Tax=Aspergillus kawachii TaxID=1069201 RepID=A0A7R7WB84_ASPKA|nr:uncharacterized protein AKAW2_50119S [Aspergillus luchuensis]BCR99777.1 hypothetical protein AKAW2_50119S [Aspergillus luchuensis]
MSFLLASLKSPANNENPPATTERAPETLTSAEKKPHSGIMPDVSHPTEWSPPDDRRPNLQAVLDESMLTDQNGEVRHLGHGRSTARSQSSFMRPLSLLHRRGC